MALIDIGSGMNKRADARSMMAVHAIEFSRTYGRYKDLDNDPTAHYSRVQHFHSAAEAHNLQIGKSRDQAQTLARGVVRENITPKTKSRFADAN